MSSMSFHAKHELLAQVAPRYREAGAGRSRWPWIS